MCDLKMESRMAASFTASIDEQDHILGTVRGFESAASRRQYDISKMERGENRPSRERGSLNVRLI